MAVISRFDREGDRRIPFLSANSLLGLPQGDPEIDRARVPMTLIADEGGESSIELAFVATARFGLKVAQARRIVCEVVAAVSQWRAV